MAGIILVTAAQGQTADSSTRDQRAQSSKSLSTSSGIASPQSFAGTWQGLWHSYPKDPDASLSLTLNVKPVSGGKLPGTISTGAFQHQPAPKQNAPLSLDAPPPHISPPPPPRPTAPPSGKMLNPRIEGGVLVFAVKAPNGKLADFRLSLHSPEAGILNVTGNKRAYPEFQMKRCAVIAGTADC
jgi:hypothetical protein